MDKKGEINLLSKIVRPEIGIITNISEAHFKNFRTLKDIAKAKGEIIKNILKNGIIVLNKDDKFYKFLSDKSKKQGLNIISFSFKGNAEVSLLGIKKFKSCYIVKINVQKRIFYFETLKATKDFITNILACISVLLAMNLNLNKIKNKFRKFPIPSGRGDVKVIKKFKKKFILIDESYNANPTSMSSAIKNMNYYKIKKYSKKIVFLGDMLDLGSKSRKFHRKLSNEINKSDIDKVFVYGKYIKETFNALSENKKGKVFNNLKEAYFYLNKIIHNNDLLMVKGSNATGLNQFTKNIKKEQIGAI